jgi:cytochrome b involved in lipid metabolism
LPFEADFDPSVLRFNMSSSECLHFIFHGKNYMVPESFVTKEHPGGKAMLLPLVNSDITEAFEESDHSQDAREMLEEWCADVSSSEKVQLHQRAEKRRAEEEEWRWRSTAIAFSVAAVVAAVVLRKSS